MLNSNDMREIFRRTKVVKRPTYGIVSGYHQLPYVCLGEALEDEHATLEVRGKVHVSPRFVLRPKHLEPEYQEIFGEDNVDSELAGRVFGFLGFRNEPVECKSEHLEVRQVDASLERVLEGVLDELERQEDITTGVLLTPDSRYYPVSIERFIASVVHEEFQA